MRREADVLDLSRRLELLRDGHAQLGPLQPFLVVDAVEAEEVNVAPRWLECVERALQSLAELLRGRLRRHLGLHDYVSAVDRLAKFAARRRASVSGGAERARLGAMTDLMVPHLSDWQNCFSEQP
eukprot:COSAG02_NODE_3049_length_7469_cov_357.503121_7_plen_125_part_00